MVKPKNNIPEEENQKFDDNAFKKAQKEAQDGKGPKKKHPKKEKPGEKAKDDLLRGNQSEREWSSESDEYRRKS